MILIPADRLFELAQAIFHFGGTSEVEANQVAERLVEANLFGHDSHGVGMAPAYMKGIKSGELNLGEVLLNTLCISYGHYHEQGLAYHLYNFITQSPCFSVPLVKRS